MKTPKKILDALKPLKDPETQESLLESGMLKDIKVSGKKVSMKVVPPSPSCAFCGLFDFMANDIKSALKKIGYKAEVEVSFEGH
jgi:metal-sulfur cluster biosynthetic enzyme